MTAPYSGRDAGSGEFPEGLALGPTPLAATVGGMQTELIFDLDPTDSPASSEVVSDSDRPLLMVVDGNSLAYRAFHALPETMTDPDGNPTGAVYGFTTMIMSLLENSPEAVAVCWDTPGPTFRHTIDPEYKQGRVAPPDSLIYQLAEIKKVVAALGITQCSDDDYEADDLVATLSRRGAAAGYRVVVVTGDRDCFQLSSDDITVWWTRRGVTDIVEVTPDWVVDRYGVSPTGYRELAALRGDTSDNLPGVPGVGEKTASKLLGSYGSIEGLYAHLDELTPRLAENLAAHRERVGLNLGMTVLHDAVPSAPSVADLVWDLPSLESAGALFSAYGFTSVWSRLVKLAA